MNKSSDRPFTSEELYFLLSKLGVNLEINEDNKEDFKRFFNKFDGMFGNPVDKQSMLDFTWLLLKLQIDIWDSKNHQIIEEAIYNKKKLSFEKEFGVENIGLNIYIKILMLELGFKPYFVGFEVFKDCILYLLNKEEVPGWTKVTYPILGKRHNLDAKQVERAIRGMLDVACSKHYDNEICKYIYGAKEHITNAECLSLVTEYVKVNYNEKFIEQYFSKNNTIDSMEHLEETINIMLNNLGISKNKGYYYLNEIIMYVLANGCNISWIELYSYIGSKYSTDSNRVERCIRFAISHSKEKYKKYVNGELNIEDASEIEKFIYKYSSAYTSSEFISLIVEYIKLVTDKSVIDNYKKEIVPVKILKK